MAKQRRKAQIGLFAVLVVLLGCLGILLAPSRANPETETLPTNDQTGQAVSIVTPKL